MTLVRCTTCNDWFDGQEGSLCPECYPAKVVNASEVVVHHTDVCPDLGCQDPKCPYQGYDKLMNEMWFGNENGPMLCPTHPPTNPQEDCHLCDATRRLQRALKLKTKRNKQI